MKNSRLFLRLSEAERAAFQRAAVIGGSELSTWVREKLRRAAVVELKEAGETVPFLEVETE